MHTISFKSLFAGSSSKRWKADTPSAVVRISGRVEAPNHDDTYKLSKGYITCDTTTDETGKFLHKLLESIKLSSHDVLILESQRARDAENASTR